MPLSVELLEAAEADRDNIWDFTVDRWGQDRAVVYLEGLRDALHLLAEFPETAPLYKEISPPVRVRPYQAHLIVYRFDESTLTAIRFLPTRSNWTRYLGS